MWKTDPKISQKLNNKRKGEKQYKKKKINGKKAKTRCCCINLVNNVICLDQLLIYNVRFELLCRITNIWIFQLDFIRKMFSNVWKKLVFHYDVFAVFCTIVIHICIRYIVFLCCITRIFEHRLPDQKVS